MAIFEPNKFITKHKINARYFLTKICAFDNQPLENKLYSKTFLNGF